MDEVKRICTSCGSERLSGPYTTSSFMRYGAFGSLKEMSYVCLDCGHVDNFCSSAGLDIIRRREMKEQEKQYRKRQETM